MSYELIQEVHTSRGDWARQLDQKFDADKLQAIKQRYDRSLRCNIVYTALCNEQRQEWLAELEQVRQSIQAELDALSKADVAKLLGYSPEEAKGTTKSSMISMYVFGEASNRIEPEHARVKRIWEGMTPNEREYGRYPESESV